MTTKNKKNYYTVHGENLIPPTKTRNFQEDLRQNGVYLVDSIENAIRYILDNLDDDSTLLYSEKENLQMFLQFNHFKNVPTKDFHNFLNKY